MVKNLTVELVKGTLILMDGEGGKILADGSPAAVAAAVKEILTEMRDAADRRMEVLGG